MFKKGNCLSVFIDSNINFSVIQFYFIYYSVGFFSYFWRFKFNYIVFFGFFIFYFDVGIQYVVWVQEGRRDYIYQVNSEYSFSLGFIQFRLFGGFRVIEVKGVWFWRLNVQNVGGNLVIAVFSYIVIFLLVGQRFDCFVISIFGGFRCRFDIRV